VSHRAARDFSTVAALTTLTGSYRPPRASAAVPGPASKARDLERQVGEAPVNVPPPTSPHHTEDQGGRQIWCLGWDLAIGNPRPTTAGMTSTGGRARRQLRELAVPDV